jgi:hypothetical protein
MTGGAIAGTGLMLIAVLLMGLFLWIILKG